MTATGRFKPRMLVLPIAALAIYAAVKHGEEASRQTPRTDTSVTLMPAPLFEGSDARKSLFRLQGWIGRHRILVVFFDGTKGATADPTLTHLLEHVSALKSTNTYVAAVSTALPSQNQDTDFPVTFALVTDLPPDFRIHRQWNCYDEAADQPQQAAFLIDQTGNVSEEDGHPAPLRNVDAEIHRLLGSDHE